MTLRVRFVSSSTSKPPGRHRDNPLLPGLPIRRLKATTPKELVLHMTVAKLLREHCLPDWRWTHFPAGEKRNIKTAAKLKQMGLQPGWPDFLFISPLGTLHCLELKRLRSNLTRTQMDFRLWCARHRVPCARASTLDEALSIFAEWECLNIKP